MADVPNTSFFNFVDSPMSATYSQFGEAPLRFLPTGSIVPVSEYRYICFEIGSCSAQTFELYIGKISGSTLSKGFAGPLDYDIHRFDVIGPEMDLWLKGGPSGLTERVQVWLYLTS